MPRSRPVFFGSRSNQPCEKYYHYFVGEVACGRWAINFFRKYLRGKKFYWFCDCVVVKEILEYTGSIHQLRRWSQKLLGYEFAIIHRKASMIKDMDDLSGHIDLLIHRYLTQSSLMQTDDVIQRPFVYSYDYFYTCSNPRHITASDTTMVTKESSLLPSLSIIPHSPINFISTPAAQSYSALSPKAHTFHHIVPS